VAERESRRTISLYAGLTLTYLLLSFALLAPMSLLASRQLPDDGDSLQGLWIMWWSGSHLVADTEKLFDGNVYHPHPHGLVYSEPMLAEGLLALPLFELFENRVLAVNLFTIATLVISCLGCHLLARELTGSHLGAFLGVLLYAFNAYVFSHLAQLQLVSIQWIPLALYCLHRYFVKPRARSAIGLVVFTVLLGLSSFYYLAFFSVALLILVPVYLWWYPFKRASLLWLIGSGLVGLLILYSATAPYRELFDRYEYTGEPASADLSEFLVPPSGSLLYRDLGAYRLSSYFLGYLSLLFAAAGIVSLGRRGEAGRDRAIWLAYLLVGVVALACAAGPELWIAGRHVGSGPYRVLEMIGPFEKLREPARMVVLVYLVLGLFLGRGAASLFRRSPAIPRFAAALFIACLVLAEHWSLSRTRGTEIPTGDAIPDAYPWLAGHPEEGPLAELPVRPFREIRRTSMEAYFSTIHRRPILFAKPSFYPPAMELLQWELRDFPDERSIALLQAFDVRFALVHPKRWRQEERLRRRRLERFGSELTLLESFPDRSLSLWNEYQLGGELLYRIASASDREAAEEPRGCDCSEVDRGSFLLSASGNAPPELALDSDRRTKWTTSGGQQEGDYFEITFDRPRIPVRVEIEMAFPYGEFPRHLEMNGYQGERGHRVQRIEDVGYSVELVRQLIHDPTKARLRYDLEPMTMDRLRLFIHRTEEATIDWSIPEIHIYETRE
jgi:hypothetical protein